MYFWRLEVQNQGVGRAMLPLKTLGKNPSLLPPASGGPTAPWLVAALLQPLPLFTWCLLLFLSLSVPSSYCKDTRHWI